MRQKLLVYSGIIAALTVGATLAGNLVNVLAGTPALTLAVAGSFLAGSAAAVSILVSTTASTKNNEASTFGAAPSITVANSRLTMIGRGMAQGLYLTFPTGGIVGLLWLANKDNRAIMVRFIGDSWYDNVMLAFFFGGVILGCLGVLMGGFGSMTELSDRLTLDGEKLTIRRKTDSSSKRKSTSFSVRWDCLERISVEGEDRKAMLIAWFRPSCQPTSEWTTKNRVHMREDGSFVIYGPAGLAIEMVHADRLRDVLPLHAGSLYDPDF